MTSRDPPGSICCAAESKAQPFPGVVDHQQPHNHQNLICYIHKSHKGLDSWGFAKESVPYAAILRTPGPVNKDREKLIETMACRFDFFNLFFIKTCKYHKETPDVASLLSVTLFREVLD